MLYINILLKKESFDSFFDFIDLNYIKDNYKELHSIYTLLQELHQQFDTDLQLGDLITAFWVKYPDADKIIYGKLFKTLQETPITLEVGQGILTQIKRRRELLKLSETAFRVAQGLEPAENLAIQYERVDHPTTPIEHSNIVTNDLDVLLEQAYQAQGLRWRLQCLNRSLGSLRKGDFGFIFARPETGKTTFLASECSNFLQQSTNSIIWFNNEEQGNKVQLRVIQAYFGCTVEQLFANRAMYRARFIDEVGDRFTLVDSGTIHKKDVTALIENKQPSVVIYDQIDKIKGFSNDREDLRLGSIYQWARELAKGGHAAIGVSQADGHAEGVKYLTMEHVANAKTAKQAEADWILGIGKTHEDGAEYVRYFNISKNKLLGDADSIPDLRHGRFEVMIRPTIARYEDVIKYD